jgi:hypothetical protein
LVSERILRVVAPVIGRADNDPMREGFFAGSGEEAVDVLFADRVVLREQLALDRVELICARCLRDKIDACVALVDSLFRRPVRVFPHLTVVVAVGRLVPEIAENQLLEVRALFSGGKRCAPVTIDDLSETRHPFTPDPRQRLWGRSLPGIGGISQRSLVHHGSVSDSRSRRRPRR